MIKVIFQNSREEEREIGLVDTEKEAYKVVYLFLKEHNYKSYYTRTWVNENNHNQTIVDVGSHSEFFILENINESE